MKLKVTLTDAQVHAIRRLVGEPGSGVHAQTWGALVRLGLVRQHEEEDGLRWYLTDDGRAIARRLRAGGA